MPTDTYPCSQASPVQGCTTLYNPQPGDSETLPASRTSRSSWRDPPSLWCQWGDSVLMRAEWELGEREETGWTSAGSLLEGSDANRQFLHSFVNLFCVGKGFCSLSHQVPRVPHFSWAHSARDTGLHSTCAYLLSSLLCSSSYLRHR